MGKARAKADQSIAKENRKYFDEVLMNHPQWGAFFTGFEDLEVGVKIGEGGQAEIFAASSPSFKPWKGYKPPPLVAKVFKESVSLRHLAQQWPPQLLSTVAQGAYQWPFLNIYGGAFIRGGKFKNRFAFVMRRQWTDLRTFIDHKMLELFRNNSHGPPLSDIKDVYHLILQVSKDLHTMHKAGVLHRDIKASNVLLLDQTFDSTLVPTLIDFECSLGVAGTGFWRAPEILEQIQRGVPSCELVFTEKADIYSFGMMCYEIITGCIPFEGHPQNDYNIIYEDYRPKLPEDFNPKLKQVIHECWYRDPEHRPSSFQIMNSLLCPYLEKSIY
jgi:serine/threonine protein kinase